MPPSPVKKGNHAQKQRLACGGDADTSRWDEVVHPTHYVLVNPLSQLVCECCFSEVEDITQHRAKKGACALYIACRHLLHCYQENTIEEFRPSCDIVSAMCMDKECPLSAKDVIAQPSSWNPNNPFRDTRYYEHTVTPGLLNTSFKTLYDAYITDHVGMVADNSIRNFVLSGVIRASSVSNLGMWIKDMLDKYLREHVDGEVVAGRLVRGGGRGGRGNN